jgi:hypothetical protein
MQFLKKNLIQAIIICTIIVVIGVVILRKDFPYDLEIVPASNSIWVVNVTDWADGDCLVVLESPEGKRQAATLYAKKNQVKINGLKNGVSYKLEISRLDILGRIRYRNSILKARPSGDIEKYVVLVGASVGKSWNLPELSERVKDRKVWYGYRGRYAFDKTAVLEKLISSQLKPDAVIIKECAAYFPRNVAGSVSAVKEWAQVLANAGIQPILATVVPVTESHDAERKVPRMESINMYNDAIRSLCTEKDFLVLDLQKILSDDKNKGYLNDSYAMSDGLHLKEDAYRSVLDNFMVDIIHNNILK